MEFTSFEINSFSEIKEIGSGGEGSVFRAKRGTFGYVVVKIFNSFVSVNRREIENIQKFSSHPNIIRFFGFVENFESTSKRTGYVMEYMDNGSVSDVIHKIQYDFPRELGYSWIHQAANALSYLHEQNLIHRDVKPSNMLLCDNFKTLKICDFGLSRVFLQNSTLTVNIGTAKYAAPEIIQLEEENNGHYDQTIDVYSLAITIWEILTKKVPYYHLNYNSAISLWLKVMAGTRPLIGDIEEEKVKNLLKRAWSADSSKRPSMEQISFSFENPELDVSSEKESEQLRKWEKTLILEMRNTLSDVTNIVIWGFPGDFKENFLNAFANYLAFGRDYEKAEEELFVISDTEFTKIDDDDISYSVSLKSLQMEEEEESISEESSFSFLSQPTKANSEEKKESHKKPRCYSLKYLNNEKEKTIRLIDIPIRLETNGIVTMEEFVDFLKNFEVIHAFCVLLKPFEKPWENPREDSAELELEMRYLLGELFSHLHCEIVRNLFFFKSFTKENFDRKHSFRTLSSFGEEINRHHGRMAIIREESIFYFNIEGFNYFAARKFSEYPETSDRFKAISSWKKAAEEVQRFMSLLQYLRDSPHETKNSIEIQNARNMMDCLDQSIIKMSQDNIDFLTKNKKGKKKIAENKPLHERTNLALEFYKKFSGTVNNWAMVPYNYAFDQYIGLCIKDSNEKILQRKTKTEIEEENKRFLSDIRADFGRKMLTMKEWHYSNPPLAVQDVQNTFEKVLNCETLKGHLLEPPKYLEASSGEGNIPGETSYFLKLFLGVQL